MHIMIIGAAGMIGRKLAQAVAKTGTLGDHSVSRMSLVDVVEPVSPDGFSGVSNLMAADLSDSAVAPKLAAMRPNVIFHLAAVVSGEAEQNFDKGYGANLDGTRFLFEAIRAEGLADPYTPRVVFTSSIAVFGAPFPDKISDTFLRTPQTSYGTQKAIGELLLEDYTRRGIFDGIGIRLPTICIRPGLPNKAASGFFSNILREPLVGKTAVLPVEDSVRHWFASPRAAVGFLVHAASMQTDAIGHRRSLNMPGLSATVAEQIEALRHVAGEKAVALIRHQPDAEIARIVAGWPCDFAPERAIALGFRAESSFEEIIRIHIEDELDGRLGV